MTADHESHLASISERLEGEVSQKIVTMKHAERARAETRFQDQCAALERCRSVDIVARRIAAGTLVVNGGR